MPDIPTQLPATCTFVAMSFVYAYFGENVNQGQILLEFAQNSGLDMGALLNGEVPLENIIDFYNQFTQTSQVNTLDGIENALEEGHPLFATLAGDDNDGIAHKVVVVGYDENTGQITYADTISGQLEVGQVEDFYTDLWFEITGIN